MANQIMVALPRFTDANGDPVSGARAYFYQSGTTTPITVYSDEALSVAHATPVVADAGGRFPQVFYGGAFQPKVVVKDAADVTLDQLDPAPMIVNITSAAENITFSPVVGNAATDVQAAIENNTTTLAGKVPTSRTIGAGTGLIGGGDLSGNRTLSIDEADAVALTAGTNGKFPDAQTIRADIDVSKRPVLATMQTATGTAVDFTGIPAGVREIIVLLNNVRLSGTNDVLVQIGDAGGIETTGYNSGSSDSGAGANSTAGFIIRSSTAATGMYGAMSLTLMDAASFMWVETHGAAGPSNASGGGAKTLSEVLTQVRITTTGANTFSAGTINIAYR